MKPGDLVLLGEFGGEKVDYCGQMHQFIADEAILGVFVDGVARSAKSFKPLRDRVLVKLAECAALPRTARPSSRARAQPRSRSDQSPLSHNSTRRLSPSPAPQPHPLSARRSQTQTSSGIAIAVGNDEAPTQGHVVAAGAGRMTSTGALAPMPVVEGDAVLFGQYAGAEVQMDGGKYNVIFAADCLAKW